MSTSVVTKHEVELVKKSLKSIFGMSWLRLLSYVEEVPFEELLLCAVNQGLSKILGFYC